MSSIFACQPTNVKQNIKTCILEGVSPCRDHVSHLICNAHAAIFGLVYKTASYHDGNNDIWSKIVTYNGSSNNISIPLFLNSKRDILVGEIYTFCVNACNTFTGIKVEALVSKISCLMGIRLSNGAECNMSWFDDINSALIIRNNSGDVQYYKDLPQLHKCLLYFVNASNIRNVNANSETYLIPNLSLTKNESSDTYSFVVPNKKGVLKYTDKPDCVATPLVLDGIRDITQFVGDRTFSPINNNFAALC